MSVRSRAAVLDAPAAPVSKGFGTGIPPAIEAAEARSQMTPTSPFSPGEPIGPYDGFSRTPRSHDFVAGYNISARPRTHEAVAFSTLKGLIGSYDVARICIRHRIASLRSLDWKLVAADGFEGDISAEVAEGKRVLHRPDTKTLFKPWLSKYLRGVLSYDAGTLYRMRNRAGRAVGLSVVDGTMIAPLQDYWGNPPDDPAPAYVQYVQGLPWNWLTRSDLVYEPYDPQDDSLYGTAPLEDILLNANTDIRFQLYFLERFTSGNLPAGFASSPDSWSPDQIEQFQEYWDAFMLGDQSRKHQIRWIPSGSKLAWTNEKDFTDSFSLFLMRKTCSAFSIVPSDLGFTETVNKSSGESQADVQHRVGDLPMAMHIQEILTDFLQEDLELPLKFSFDLGEEQDDRLNQAQSDDIYVKNGTVSSSEVREWRFGITDPEPVPRFLWTERSGPIPLSAMLAVAGPVDPATGAPAENAPLPHKAFAAVEGVLPNPPVKVPGLAVQRYGPEADPAAAAAAAASSATPVAPAAPVAKEGEGGNVTAGITTATGLYSYDLDGQGDDEDEAERAKAVKKELADFRNFRQRRRRAGNWQDFKFHAVDRVRGHNLNDYGRSQVRKDAGEIAVAGLAVLAADTGRVLMLQRALDESDPAAGMWEMPGGHCENGESPLRAAWREWSEETGCAPPPGAQTGSWTSPDGIYQGIVWTTETEESVPVRGDSWIPNPDDPDGDSAEAIAWWDPETLPGNPAVRPELLANIDDVMAALGYGVTDDAAAEAEAVAKAAKSNPKARAWHGWTLDEKTAAHWAPKVRDSVKAAVPKAKARDMGRDYLTDHPGQDGSAPGKRDRNTAAAAWVSAWLAGQGVTLVPPQTAEAIAVDGYAIGAVSAQHQVTGQPPAAQKPGDTSTAFDRAEEAGLAAALALLLHGGNGATPAAIAVAERIAAGYARALAIILAGTDADWADDQETLDELGDLLTGALADENTAVTLVGTEINVYSGLAAHAYYMANSVAWISWQTEDDGRVCPRCGENEDAGPVLAGQPFPDGHTSTPGHANCFPAGVVVTGPSVVAATARRYEGDLVTIVFADGQEVPVTPNHPVLTPDGWVAAGDLREGGEVLRTLDAERVTLAVCPDDRHAVARIEDVAKALGEDLPVMSAFVPVAPEDFHGDGSGDHYVDVVRAAGNPVGHLLAETEEHVPEFGLEGAEGAGSPREGDRGALGAGEGAPPGALVGAVDHGVPLALLGSLPSQAHRGGAVAPVDADVAEHPVRRVPIDAVLRRDGLNRHAAEVIIDEPLGGGLAAGMGGLDVAERYASFDETRPERRVADAAHGGAGLDGASGDVGADGGIKGVSAGGLASQRDPGLDGMVPDRATADARNGRALVDRLAGLVGVERVSELRRVNNWTGHVYNLETVSGWYFANGIIAHNCRCAIIPSAPPGAPG